MDSVGVAEPVAALVPDGGQVPPEGFAPTRCAPQLVSPLPLSVKVVQAPVAGMFWSTLPPQLFWVWIETPQLPPVQLHVAPATPPHEQPLALQPRVSLRPPVL